MKKSLITLAIVGALASPMVAQAAPADIVERKAAEMEAAAARCAEDMTIGEWPESCQEMDDITKSLTEMKKAGLPVTKVAKHSVNAARDHFQEAYIKHKGWE